MSITQPLYGICDTCKSKTEVYENRCQLCHQERQDQRKVRIGGAALTIIGLIIIGMMSFIINLINHTIAQSKDPRATTKWNASPDDTNLIMTVLYVVLAFGVSGLIAGLWHLVTGKRNKILLFAMIGLGVALTIGAKIIVLSK